MKGGGGGGNSINRDKNHAKPKCKKKNSALQRKQEKRLLRFKKNLESNDVSRKSLDLKKE